MLNPCEIFFEFHPGGLKHVHGSSHGRTLLHRCRSFVTRSLFYRCIHSSYLLFAIGLVSYSVCFFNSFEINLKSYFGNDLPEYIVVFVLFDAVHCFFLSNSSKHLVRIWSISQPAADRLKVSWKICSLCAINGKLFCGSRNFLFMADRLFARQRF
jgi:hypothetical protein